ncbi:hypothetical protein CEK26_002190 [Fusarium fujikuroi]|nr:hypothetical protein CEK27_002187 [Fusarium fujikuroi]QGI87233.1 hypothetical protein CEK25_002189 [Fusarium fujikuroi]QGJ00746.1 hypothetical protein CEK26_002190 [Fusarium fujikuroi]
MHRYSVQRVGDEYVYTRIFEEWEDSDYVDDDEELVISQENAQLIAWIDGFEESMPTIEEVHARYHELVGKHIADDISSRNAIERFWLHRLMNGTAKRDGILRLPGYGLPLSFGIDNKKRQPFLLGLHDEDWKSRTLMNREVCMLKLEEDITNKPHWWEKVLKTDIVYKWKQEALQMPWASYQHNGDFTSKMADACFKDLAAKAKIYEQMKLIPVMESSSCAIKSDALLSHELTQKLRTAAALLEDVPGPSETGIREATRWCWTLFTPHSGRWCLADLELSPTNTMPDGSPFFTEYNDKRALSLRYQWLPCDVDLTGSRPRIKSYINNLHPVRYKAVYSLIEELIEKSLPAWDIVCRSARKEFRFKRFGTVHEVKWTCNVPEICSKMPGCYPSSRSFAEGGDYDSGSETSSVFEEGERLNREWWSETHKIKCPEPLEDAAYPLNASHCRSEGFFRDASQIQVVLKMANIHLTPEKPRYDGGSWHVEGQLNEHICATALFYYDSDNITESRLSFRTHADRDNLRDRLSYSQGDHHGIEAIFAIKAKGDKMQDLGSVMTPEGRALFFPNVYQHRVESFELADKTRPGYRKIVALFLVDPVIPIISTGNVPPQQKHWWKDELRESEPLNYLPSEIMDMIKKSVLIIAIASYS